MLYPAELSSGDVPESNRCSRRFRRCLTPRPSSSGTPVPTFRHTPRQRRTHRTGHKPVPLRRVRRCSALPAVANRQSVRTHGAHFVVPSERRSRRSITTQRTCAGCSRAPASGRAGALPGCSRAETRSFPVGWNETCSMHAHPPRTPETKRPRDLRPEGVRVPREIGGGRSPRESAVISDPGTARLRRHATGRTRPRRGRATGQTGSCWREGGSWKSVR